jgi:hypothetical protein
MTTQAKQSLQVSREKLRAMLSVLNKRWLSKGWNAMERENAEPMALVFIERLNEENVPYQLYEELFNRSVKMRAQRMAQGLGCDDFSVDMMLACWPALRKEIREKEIASKSMLPETAESRCPRCMGLGKEYVFDAEGKLLGVKQTCDHRPLVEGEWLYQERERIEKLGDKPIEIKTHVQTAMDQMTMGKVKPVADDGRELLGWCQKEFLSEYLASQRDETGIRRFKYSLFRTVWHVRWDESEWERTGMIIFHAQDYIRLGPQGYAALKQREAK